MVEKSKAEKNVAADCLLAHGQNCYRAVFCSKCKRQLCKFAPGLGGCKIEGHYSLPSGNICTNCHKG